MEKHKQGVFCDNQFHRMKIEKIWENLLTMLVAFRNRNKHNDY